MGGIAYSQRASFPSFHAHSPQATAITELFNRTLLLCGGVFIVVALLVVYCVVNFRDDRVRAPAQVEGNLVLEICWTIAPIVALVWLLGLTVRAMSAAEPSVDHSPDITIVAHQWWWEVKYASGAVTANEIHIPTGEKLVVRLESADVIHDFWVPELARKMDATPGHPTTISIEADEPGAYGGACAEYCGTEHAWMRTLVIAESPGDFATWLDRHQRASAPPKDALAARGKALFHDMTCINCHNADGPRGAAPDRPTFAPDLSRLSERTTLGAGVVENTPAELARWLRDPQLVKAGCHMPNARLSESQVDALVAYLDSSP